MAKSIEFSPASFPQIMTSHPLNVPPAPNTERSSSEETSSPEDASSKGIHLQPLEKTGTATLITEAAVGKRVDLSMWEIQEMLLTDLTDDTIEECDTRDCKEEPDEDDEEEFSSKASSRDSAKPSMLSRPVPERLRVP